MAKYMVRAYAHEDPEPKSVLKRLNEALAEFVPDETFITLFYGLLDIERNIFAYANAGHEPPVLCGADCKAMALDVTGPAVGMLAKANYSQRTMPLFPGSSIVIYTDGITDSRVGTSFFGIEGLSRVVVNRIGEGALVVADAIYNAALDHAEGRLADDAALLVVRVKNSADSSRHRDGKVNNRADTVPDLHQ
jgi:sigma-B regulation protein RsbU (phosphoserine phosphatase)